MKKRITVLEIIIIAVILSISALFLSPRFTYTKQQRQEATVRANVSMAVSTIKSIFAVKPKSSMTKIAEVAAITLNKTVKNPIDKKNKAYIVNTAQKGAVNFVADDKKDFIIITGYAENTQTPLITQKIQK